MPLFSALFCSSRFIFDSLRFAVVARLFLLHFYQNIRYNHSISEIYKIKERINYLKVWLGIFVVTNIGLIGWLAEHYEDGKVKAIAAFSAIMLITALVALIHKKINNKIDELEEL